MIKITKEGWNGGRQNDKTIYLNVDSAKGYKTGFYQRIVGPVFIEEVYGPHVRY